MALKQKQLATNSPNYIINGNFDHWQRKPVYVGGNNALSPSGGGNVNSIFADRFSIVTGVYLPEINGGSLDVRSTDIPPVIESGIASRYSHYIKITMDWAGDMGEAYIKYAVETTHLTRLYGKICTLSFWVKHTTPGVYAVAFRDSNNGSYVKTYTVYTSNVWEFKYVTVDLTDSGVVDFNTYPGEPGLNIHWVIDGKTSEETPNEGVWVGGKHLTVPGLTQMGNIIGNEFLLAQVQLVEGSTPNYTYTYFGGSPDTDYLGCKRYYETSYGSSYRGPATGDWDNMLIKHCPLFSNNQGYIHVNFQVEKAYEPSVDMYSPQNIAFRCMNYITWVSNNEIAFEAFGGKGFIFTLYNATNYNIPIAFHYTADAEI